jgi:hypothetical protein
MDYKIVRIDYVYPDGYHEQYFIASRIGLEQISAMIKANGMDRFLDRSRSSRNLSTIGALEFIDVDQLWLSILARRRDQEKFRDDYLSATSTNSRHFVINLKDFQ